MPLLNLWNQPIVLVDLFMINETPNICYFRFIFSAYSTLFFKLIQIIFSPKLYFYRYHRWCLDVTQTLVFSVYCFLSCTFYVAVKKKNLLNVRKVVCQWSLKGHFGQWIDIHWICQSRIRQGIYTVSRCWVIIGNASCLLSPGIRVWQCWAMARLTKIYNGELRHSSFPHLPPGVAYRLASLGNDNVKYVWAKSSQVLESDSGRLVGDIHVRHSLLPFMSIGLFQKKFKQGVGQGYIYFSKKRPLGFVDLSLYPYKKSFYPWKFPKILIHPLEISRLKIQDPWKA